jgi:hypothetical protein
MIPEGIKVEPLNFHPIEFSRVTVNLNVHHELAGEQPRSFCFAFQDFLKSSQESYSRKLHALSGWTKLDLGWVEPDEVGYVLIDNLEERNELVYQTEEEKHEAASRIIEIAYEDSLNNYWPIPPRLFFFCPVARPEDLRIRCQNGTARCRVTIIPK